MSEDSGKRVKLEKQPFDELRSLVPEDWSRQLNAEFDKRYFTELTEFLNFLAKRRTIIYPEHTDMFRAFIECPWEKVKVIILGQDPFVGEGQAEGLCFSVKKTIPIPPSTKNIYTELETDIKAWKRPDHGCLLEWAREGVLLLNALLTVTAGEPGSHSEIGWEDFTDKVIEKLNLEKENLVFLLWGGYAKTKGSKIDRKKHLVLTSGHPSPRSEQLFFGNHHFSEANKFLISKNITPINWSITTD